MPARTDAKMSIARVRKLMPARADAACNEHITSPERGWGASGKGFSGHLG